MAVPGVCAQLGLAGTTCKRTRVHENKPRHTDIHPSGVDLLFDVVEAYTTTSNSKSTSVPEDDGGCCERSCKERSAAAARKAAQKEQQQTAAKQQLLFFPTWQNSPDSSR